MNRPKCCKCNLRDCEISHKSKDKIYYRDLCWKCRSLENPNYHSHYKKYNDKCRQTVLNHYGAKCVCCGETVKQFLTIDHINGGGNQHRKEVGSGRNMMVWIIKNNFPKDFQILCFNCNCGRQLNKGICPHKHGLIEQ